METCRVWASASVRDLAHERWPAPEVADARDVAPDCDTLIVVGGGRMMDEAKFFRAHERPAMKLVLVPSLWGSGAERSPIVVLNREGAKRIEISSSFLPDEVIYWPELLRSVPADRARQACGDVWSHALEAFLSPLGGEENRAALALLIQEMLELPLSADERWFDASARACELQANASVGLVHGIAHVLEGPLAKEYPSSGWGHAKLCSVFLLPVMELNRQNSTKWAERAAAYGLDELAVWAVLRALYDDASYREAAPLLAQRWPQIQRDACTRTNGTLVRAQAIQFFQNWATT